MPTSALVERCVCIFHSWGMSSLGQQRRWNNRERLVTTAIVFGLLNLCACGGSSNNSSGGDPSPAFHSISIITSPLPSSPIALGLSPLLAQIDCYPGSTVRLYGTDTLYAQGTAAPSTSDATSKMQWSSSDPSVASVSAGLVTCIKQGTTQITGNIPGDKCDGEGTPCSPLPMPLTVGSAKHTLTLSPNSVSLNSGQSQQMTVSLITETAPGVSTTQDLTAEVFTNPGALNFLVVGSANYPPIDFDNSQNGNYVAQGSGSAIVFVTYPSGSEFDYVSNLVLFTSK
jgi:hypothetical protein